MRIIKFRGFNKKNQKWIYGYYFVNRGKHFIVEDGIADPLNTWEDYVVDEETIGQFTGLFDKNAKEIYEWDIVRNKEIGGYGSEYIGVVRYYEEDCRFGIDTTTTNKFTKRLLFTDGECSFNDGHCTIKYCNEYEVLGNIFDHPELLKSL